jgi:RNA polymerase sigma-70 factor, ECF subfamily
MNDIGALYRQHAPDVYRYALYLSGQRAEAEDITSETFARVWTSSAPIVMATVKGYLFTIARHLYLQGLRRSLRHDALGDELPDPGAGPEREAESSERLGATVARLQLLPELSRSAVLMHAVDGMAYEEIARVLGLTVAAVKVRIHRARFALAAGA